MSNYVETKNKIDVVRNKYGCKGDLIFKDAKGHICFKYHYSNTDCPDGDWLFYYYVEQDLLIWCDEY